MSNQQVQNVLTALEEATDISVSANLTDESVTIEDSTGDQLAIDTSGNITVADVVSTLTVTDDGTLAIDSLPEPLDVSGATVSVQENTALDVSGATVTVTDDGALDVNTVSGQVDVVDQPGSTGSYGSASVGTTAQEVLTASTGRRSLLIQNNGSAAVYVGFDSTVSASSGVKVPAGGTYADETYSGALYVISGSGTNDIRFQEVTA